MMNGLRTTLRFMRLLKPRNYIKLLRHILTNSPKVAMVAVTYGCQCKCIHCSAGLYPDDGEVLDTDEMKNLIHEISQIGVPRLHLTGGEPLLREDIFELIRYSSSLGIITVLETNGIRLDENCSRMLKESNVSWVFVSIDSADKEVHDSKRNLECYDKALNAILNCKKVGIPCFISTYAAKENINDGSLERVLELGEALKVNAVRILPARASGRWLNNNGLALNDEERTKLSNILKKHKIGYFSSGKTCELHDKGTFYISPSGEVQPCSHVPIKFGDLKEESLKAILPKIWNSKLIPDKKARCILETDEYRENVLKKLKDERLPVDFKEL